MREELHHEHSHCSLKLDHNFVRQPTHRYAATDPSTVATYLNLSTPPPVHAHGGSEGTTLGQRASGAGPTRQTTNEREELAKTDTGTNGSVLCLVVLRANDSAEADIKEGGRRLRDRIGYSVELKAKPGRIRAPASRACAARSTDAHELCDIEGVRGPMETSGASDGHILCSRVRTAKLACSRDFASLQIPCRRSAQRRGVPCRTSA